MKCKTTTKEDRRRSSTLHYTVTSDQKTIEVCRAAFLAMHGIIRGSVRSAMKKVTQSSTPVTGKRGKIVGMNTEQLRAVACTALPMKTPHRL